MQWSLHLDLASIHEWGLNVQQGVVFAYIYSCPSWCQRAKDDPEFFNLSTGKLATELSMVSEKRDTMLRHVMCLVDHGLLERRTIGRNQYLKLTEKALGWNRKREINPVSSEMREENPDRREENPASTGNFSEESVIPISDNHQKIEKPPAKNLEQRITEALVDAYHDRIPWGQHVSKWTKARATQLRRLLSNHPETREEGLWDAYFAEAARDKFIRGEVPPKPGQDVFRPSIDYLLRETVYADFYEKSEDRVRRAAS